jgi:hypothetical protein
MLAIKDVNAHFVSTGFCIVNSTHVGNALRISGVRPFVLYSLRHTFLTRLGASGCDAWTLARIAGHSSVAISARYVHPSEETVLAAVERLGGHRIEHNPKPESNQPLQEIVQAPLFLRDKWSALEDDFRTFLQIPIGSESIFHQFTD